MGGAVWAPKESFSGELDGDGHCIYNFSISKTGGRGTDTVAFIKKNTGTISDLTIGKKDVGSYDGYSVLYIVGASEDFSESSLSVGGVVGENKGTISGCYLMNSRITAAFSDGNNDKHLYLYVGGITALNFGTISNCHVKNSIIDADAPTDESGDDNHGWLGGICGKNSTTLSHCTVQNTTLDLDVRGDGFFGNAANPKGYLGGIVAEQLQGTTTLCSVQGNTLKLYVSSGGYTSPTKKVSDICGLRTGGTVSN